LQFAILNLLENILDQKALLYKDDNVAFWCPACKKIFSKKKLIVCLDENSDRFGFWNCWVCGYENNMRGRNLINLFKKLNSSEGDLYKLLNLLRYSKKSIDTLFHKKYSKESEVKLPVEFKLLSKYYNKEVDDYLKSRGINELEILRYNIGYCETGNYKFRVIIPSYDANENLNYFVARSYIENWLPKYKNPPNNNNIIFNELFINWNYPVVLTEGIFDSLTMKRNAIPLLGKNINETLQLKFLIEDVKEIIIALDSDAKSASLKYIEQLISNGINVKFLELKDNKDINQTGFEKVIELYNNSKNIDFQNLIELKFRI